MNLRRRMMKIHDFCDESGKLVRFEISNTFLSRYAARRIVRSIPGVQVLKEPSFLATLHIDGGEEEFIKFELGGRTFHVYEPFADSSSYLVGPDEREPTDEIGRIRAVFEQASPSPVRIGILTMFVGVALYLAVSTFW